jgi:predicted CXXCH cytochrome family protein
MSHSNLADAQSLGISGTSLNSSCGRCHTAQGYTLYAAQLNAGNDTLGAVPSTTLALVNADNVEPQTCTACHDPHDATNPNQLRFYDSTPNLPGGFAGAGMGKGALCLTCHNSRNGSQTGSTSLTYLHEDTETYNSGNPLNFDAPHQADQGDVFEGHNAYFLGSQTPMLSRHAAITDTCAGCHMTLQPETGLEFGTATPLGHEFRIVNADIQTLCSNCHGSNVNGAGIQASVSAQLAQLDTKLGKAVIAKVAAVGGIINVAAYDDATGDYSSKNGATANVQVNTTANAIVSASLEEVHGQIAVLFTLTNAITIPYITSTGAAAPKTTTTFAVQLGSLYDNEATPVALYLLSGGFVRAGWNYFLISSDQSLGLHNPSFVNAVLDASLAATVTD